jgi:hypothetical protein
VSAKAALILILTNALLSAAIVFAYALVFAPDKTPPFALLDVAELYRIKETQVTAVLVKREASVEERALAMRRAAAFGAELSTVLQSLRQECRCLILARGAIVGPTANVPDLTPDVRRRLGL